MAFKKPKLDPKPALHALISEVHDPNALVEIGGEGMWALVKYLTTTSPWSELVDLSGAVSMVFAAASRTNQTLKASPEKQLSVEQHRAAWVDGVTNELLRYPREYVVLVELPGVEINGELGLELAPDTRLVRSANPEPPSTFGETNALTAALGVGLKRPVSPQTVICLEIKTTGHLGQSESSSAASNAISRAKQILELFALSGYGLVADSNIAKQRESKILGSEPTYPDDMVFVQINEDLRQTLGAYKYEPRPTGGGLLGLLSGKAQEPSPAESIHEALKRFSALLHAKRSNEDVIRVLTGLEWAFDAAMTRNETQALLSACIGIEALLGRSETESSLTEKLADRCAYLLGQSAQERNEIAKSFKTIYSVRSHVVHGRSRRLEPSQRGVLDDSRRLLTNIHRREAAQFPAL